MKLLNYIAFIPTVRQIDDDLSIQVNPTFTLDEVSVCFDNLLSEESIDFLDLNVLEM